MKKILSITALIIALTFSSAIAQNKEIPSDAVVVNITLTEETTDQAKKLKGLETATLFKGTSQTEFQCYLNKGANLEDLQKELADLISGSKAVIRKN